MNDMPPGIYDITDKTYIRPADRIDELVGSEDQLFGKYAEHFSGIIWNVKHDLRNTNLIIGVWKDDPTSPASFWSITQLDYENLRINWTMPVDGRVVIYSVRPFVGVAIIHTQDTPSTTWTIVHNFGTLDVIYTCWTGGTIITPVSAQTLDNNTVELTFAMPVAGSCVMIIADPEMNPSIHVDWTNIYNLPSGFPPSPHTHTSEEIIGSGLNITTFAGYPVEDFVMKRGIGLTVAPLEVRPGTDPAEYQVPAIYMPDPIYYQFGDSDGTIKVLRTIAVSTGNHPLFVVKDPDTHEARLDIHPVLRKIQLTGNFIHNPSVPDDMVKVDTNYNIRLVLGSGLYARAEDNNTLKLSLSSGAGNIFTRAVMLPGDEWDIMSPLLDIQGNYILGVYETDPNPRTIKTAQTNHVPITTPPFDTLDQVFEVKGDRFMELSGRVINDSLDFTEDHFIWNDTVMKDLLDVPVPAPANTDAIYWDTSDNTYLMKTPASGGWAYIKFNPNTRTSYTYGIVMSSATYEHTAVCGGSIYAIHEIAGGAFELLSATFSSIPIWTWQNVTTFATEPMPVVSSGGKLRFRVQGDFLYLLNTTLNSFSVYSISGSMKLWEKPMPKPVRDFDLWPDGYASFCCEGEDSLQVTDQPAQNYVFTLRKSIDHDMGDCHLIAIRDDGSGALGIYPPNIIQYSTESYQNPTSLYKTGKLILWLKPPFTWQVPLLWSQMLSMTWDSYNIDSFDDVRIGFFPGESPTMPPTLYWWTGTSFTPFPAVDLPTLGQPLTAVNNIQLLAGEKLSYALYIRKDPVRAVEGGGFITHNFTVTYTDAGLMYPVPIGGTSNNTDHLEVHCAPGAIKIINTLGRTLNGMKVVITPAM